jgi:RNA polymerase sigma-70 factor (ECF subfamily)
MANEPTDAELIAAIAAQDRDAFHAFYDRYAAKVLSYVRMLARQREIAEDVVQEVFLSVWRKAPSYRPDRGDVPGWLYTITRNKLVDVWRRKGGMVEDEEFDFDQLLAPDAGGERQVVGLAVRRALGELKPEQREALTLAYFGGLTYEETAERLALPLGTLKSRIRAGLAILRGVLSEASPSAPPTRPS